MFRRSWMALALLLGLTTWSLAQDEKAAEKPAEDKPAAEKPADEAADSGAAGDFAKQFAEWKEMLAKLRSMRARWYSAKPDERKTIETEYAEVVKEGEAMEPKIIAGAEAAYAAEPNGDEEIGKFLAELVNEEAERDDYEPALKRAQLLIEHNYDNPRIYNLAGIAALCTNQFDLAEKYLKDAQQAGSLDNIGQLFLSKLNECRELWEKEAKIREEEAKADDLPRVLIKTSKGDIVVELFENEAPNTVANFISLVESGFYNGLTFPRVLPHFMAQGGDPNGDTTGGPGYNIPDEQGKPEHRNHFRGSLSMAKTAAPDSAGSQFFLMFRPSGPIAGYDLNGKHCVFGRIIDGMGVLAKIHRTENEKGEPTHGENDKIVEAKVLRKRDHEYKVVKAGEAAPPAAEKKGDGDKKEAAEKEKSGESK